jgi:two-component system sensor histidine kinase SenX3
VSDPRSSNAAQTTRPARPTGTVRRLESRRLQAALTRLGPTAGHGATGPDGLDQLLHEVEAAAAEAAEWAEGAEHDVSRLSAALNALGVGVVICDEHGGEAFRNVAANSFGRARIGDVLADRAVAEVLDEARRGMAGERSLELFSPVRRNVAIRAFPISTVDGPLGAVAVIEDVSERRRLEAIRRDFVANVSHELKTPVGALSLLAETLVDEEDSDNVARLSARVAMEAERLGRIIDDLLDLSRIEANEGPRYDRVPLHTILADATQSLRPVATARRIGIEVDVPPAHLSVPGDRRDLVSAVSNLVDNAVKYSEPGSQVRVGWTCDEDLVRIAVADNGIGIPIRDRDRIFERFYRVDRARSRSTGGTGLGLSIVRHVAANHGGEVTVESREGEGSTFTLVLPMVEGAEPSEVHIG